LQLDSLKERIYFYFVKRNILKFVQPKRAITSGQSVVFYLPAKALAKTSRGQELLGGGVIKK